MTLEGARQFFDMRIAFSNAQRQMIGIVIVSRDTEFNDSTMRDSGIVDLNVTNNKCPIRKTSFIF